MDVCPTGGAFALLFFFVFVRFALRFRILGGGGGRFGFLEKLGFLLLHGVGFLRQRGHAFVIAEVAEVLAVDRLVDEQIFRERDEHVGVGAEDLLTLERGLVWPKSRPMKMLWPEESKLMGPRRSLMPYTVTMLRAVCVAC